MIRKFVLAAGMIIVADANFRDRCLNLAQRQLPDRHKSERNHSDTGERERQSVWQTLRDPG